MKKRNSVLNKSEKNVDVDTDVQKQKSSSKGHPRTYGKNLVGKIFSGGTIATDLMSDELPNPSKVLERCGMSPADLYRDMLEDDHIYSVVEILIAGILRHQWKISSDNPEHKKVLEDAFTKAKIRNMIKGIVEGRLKGMSIFEIVWEVTDAGYVPAEINPLPSTDFSIKADDTLIHTPSGTIIDPENPIYQYKFILYRNNPYNNPYGVAEILKCYYPWQFKKGGWRFWMTTTEKYGIPTLIVEVDDTDADDIDATLEKVATAFFNIDSDTVIVTNGLKDKGVNTIEVKAKSEEFEKLINKAESAISKVIIGTHIIMDSSSGGSRALAEVAANINFRFKVQETILDICDCVNQIISWFNIMQFGTTENKFNTKFSIPYINIQDWEKIREAMTWGVPVSLKAIYQHVPEPENEGDVFISSLIMSKTAPDPNMDIKSPTPDSKSDTDDTRKAKTDKKKGETRVETSIPGKQNTGANQ